MKPGPWEASVGRPRGRWEFSDGAELLPGAVAEVSGEKDRGPVGTVVSPATASQIPAQQRGSSAQPAAGRATSCGCADPRV